MKERIRKILIGVLLLILILPVFAYASDEQELPKTNKVGVIVGGIFDAFCDKAIPGSVPEYYYTAADMPLALEAGKIDAYIDDELSAIAHCKSYNNIRIDKVVYSDHYGFIFNRKNGELCDKMSEFIIRLREDGTLDELKKIWIDGEDESIKHVDYNDLPAENGTLKIAIAATMPPMVYVKDGQYAGYEIDVLVKFCKENGYGIEFSNSDFSSVLASVTSGVSDIGACSISITDERKKSMLFSESHVEANGVSVVRKNDADANLTITDYANSRIGVLESSVNVSTAEKYFPDALLYYFSSNYDIASALDKNKIDAYITDEPSARNLLNEYENQTILTALESSSYAFALPKSGPDSEKLKEQFDNFLYKIKENGELRKIEEKWFGTDESVKTVDLGRLKKNSKVLTFAVFAADPFVYVKDGQYVGYEVDIIAGFCEEYGYDLDINEYSLDNLFITLDNGKCDIAAGDISVTEERQEKYLFTVPDYDSGNVFVVNKINGPTIESSFFSKIKDSFYKTFIQENRWKLFVQGILTTFFVSLLSVICGTGLAFVVYMLYHKNIMSLNKVINACCEVIEKTPAVVILMILYYLIFGKLDVNAGIVASLGLSMKFSVRVFGLFRIGVGSINKGQTEAALALGYPPNKAFLRIVFPQAVMHIFLGYKSSVVNLIEETAVVGYIAVQDLTKISDIIRSRTYEAFFPLIVSALIYILIAVLFITIIKKIEFGFDPKSRKESDILKGVNR